jgi:hypothetical protein
MKPSVFYAHGLSNNFSGFHISSGMEFWSQAVGRMLVIFVSPYILQYFCAHSCPFYWFAFANVATAVILSVTGAAPFNGSSDQNLSVAYISAFILVFLVKNIYYALSHL